MLNATAHRRPRAGAGCDAARPDNGRLDHALGRPCPRKTDPVDEHIGKAVRSMREAAGMSQEALAQRLGLTFQQVQKYEKATNRVSASRLVAIARVLGTTPAAFLPPATEAGRRRAAELEATLTAVEGLLDQHRCAIAALEDIADTLAKAALAQEETTDA